MEQTQIETQRIQTSNRFGKAFSEIWDALIYILFWIITAIAAFSWGIIYENRRHDGLQERINQIESKQKDQNGRIIALEKPQPKSKR